MTYFSKRGDVVLYQTPDKLTSTKQIFPLFDLGAHKNYSEEKKMPVTVKKVFFKKSLKGALPPTQVTESVLEETKRIGWGERPLLA